jgi:hypothetical protein
MHEDSSGASAAVTNVLDESVDDYAVHVATLFFPLFNAAN